MNEINRFDDQYDTLFYHKGKSLIPLDSFDLKYEDPRITLENLGREALPFDGLSIGSNHQNRLLNYNTSANFFAPLPYFRFFYSIGSNTEQNIHLIFAQNIKKGFGYHFTYDRIVGTSFQRELRTRKNVLNVGMYYKNKSYHLKLGAQFFDNRLSESGGITSDSLLLLNGLENVSINKLNAQRRFKGISSSLLNRVNFIKDSSSTLKHGFFMRNMYNLDYSTYAEDGILSTQYDSIYFDSLSTYDKFQYAGINNHIGYYLKTRLFQIELGYGFDYYQQRNLGNDPAYRDHYFNSAVSLEKWKKLSFTNYFDFYFSGRKQGDINQRFNASYVDSSWQATAEANFKVAEPTLRQNSYRGNTFQFNNNFVKMQQLELKLKGQYQNHFMTIGGSVEFQSTNKAVYWDSTSFQQLTNSATFIKAGIHSKFKFWKIINDLNINYRYSSSDIIRVPSIEINDRIYFKGRIFKSKKLLFITGLGIRYYSKYDGYGFTPNMSEFSLSDQSLQNFPNLDFFLMLQISKVNFFFKIENWSSSFYSKSHYAADGYPIRPTYFKLGLEWEFFN